MPVAPTTSAIDIHGFLLMSPARSRDHCPRGRRFLAPDQDSDGRRNVSAILTITFISLPFGSSSERKPLSTIASGSIRPVMIFSTGKFAAGNHPDHARPHCDLVAPGRFDRDVLIGPERGVDDGLLDMQASLHNDAATAHGLNASIQGRFDSGAFDRGIHSNPLLRIVADKVNDVDRLRIEHGGRSAKAFDHAATIGVRLADEDLRCAHGIADQYDERPDRTSAVTSTVLPPVTFARSTP